MKRHVQLVHCTVGFINRLIDQTLVVEPQRVESLPATMQKVQHRAYFVPERFGLLGGEARAFHAATVYTYR
jgi:hypothetical protein